MRSLFNSAPRVLACALLVFAAMPTSSVQACAVCWGKENGKITDAMGFSILFLLVLIGLVLMGVVTSFVVMARRASRFPVPSDEFREKVT
ncbi:MAG: hypothetical protein HC904_17780 [Blastochloris sp.]|nr:hypothetical protein [Blastochloris sp.]